MAEHSVVLWILSQIYLNKHMYIKPPGRSGSISSLFLQQKLNKICHPVCLETSWDDFQQETGCEPSPAPHYCQSGMKHLWSHHRLRTSIDFYEDRTGLLGWRVWRGQLPPLTQTKHFLQASSRFVVLTGTVSFPNFIQQEVLFLWSNCFGAKLRPICVRLQCKKLRRCKTLS